MTLSILVLNVNSVFAQEIKSKTLKEKINIEITSHLGDKQLFVKGDDIKFLINLDTDAYITVIYQTADQQLIQLIPNKKQASVLYKAGFFIKVPNANAPYRFTIQKPYGKEKVWVLASDREIKMLSGKSLVNGLRQINIDIAMLKKIISDDAKKYFGIASFTLNTSIK